MNFFCLALLRIIMKITKPACEYVTEQAPELKEPIIVVFEREYRGWCGVSKVVNVLPVNKSQIPDSTQFVIKEMDDCKYPLYLEKHLEHLWATGQIDIAGWAAFRRLVLLQH